MADPLTIQTGRRDVVVEVSSYAQQAISEAVDYVHKSDDVVIGGVSDFLDAVNEATRPMRIAVGLKFDGVRVGLACWNQTEMMLRGAFIECGDERAAIDELRAWSHDDAFKVGFAEDEDCGTYTATVVPVSWTGETVLAVERKLALTTALVVSHFLVRLRIKAGDEVPQVKQGLIYRSY